MKRRFLLLELIFLTLFLSCANPTDSYPPPKKANPYVYKIYQLKCLNCLSIKTEIPEKGIVGANAILDLKTPAYDTCQHIWIKENERIYIR